MMIASEAKRRSIQAKMKLVAEGVFAAAEAGKLAVNLDVRLSPEQQSTIAKLGYTVRSILASEGYGTHISWEEVNEN